MKNPITISYNFLLDLIFPRFCVGCKTEGFWICPECDEKIFFVKSPYCPSCHRLTPKGQYCPRCKSDTFLTGAIIATYYKKGPIKEAIHYFKYEGITELKKGLGSILSDAILARSIGNNLVLIAVPLHHHRLRERGYNQAKLLTDEISKNLRIPVIDKKLVKIKSSTRQADLTRSQRLKNVVGLFDWVGESNELKGKTVILVDDVLTTGATLSECAKVLRQKSGAQRVWGAVIAKG